MSDEAQSVPENSITGTVLVNGTAKGDLLVSDVGISFWGGVDPFSGEVIDEHHPLKGQNVKGKVLAIPSGRGSCSGSGALLELILNDCAPAALVFTEAEDILTLGVLVADAMFDRTLPVIRVQAADFNLLKHDEPAEITGPLLRIASNQSTTVEPGHMPSAPVAGSGVSLSELDLQLLDGAYGDAAKMAMGLLLRIAEIQGATRLIDVSQAHIDSCIYHGPSSLEFARQLVKRDAKVRIPTTLNSISIDERRWREHGVDESLGEPASQLGYAFMEMGAKASYTCAPYLLNSAPVYGDQIVWAESNAVMFANSVIGARTQKYPDFLDIFIALTGRAPASGSHLDAGRQPTICIQVEPIQSPDDAFWPLLGYHIGLQAANDIPLIYGLETAEPSMDDLKAFSAAFATTSSAPMFHMNEVTPEAIKADHYCRSEGLYDKSLVVTAEALRESFGDLNTAKSSSVEMICLGNPHFSVTECEKLSSLCAGRDKHERVRVLVTLGRDVYADAEERGHIDGLKKFGVEFITDTCWCMITEPVIAPQTRHLMTNSGKYAHYGPALVKREMHFGGLAACVDAACQGHTKISEPAWLTAIEVSSNRHGQRI